MRSRLIVAVALMALLAVAAPAAAVGDDDDGELRTYEVTLTNKTTSQPISPPVVVTHDRDLRFWHPGDAASAGTIAIAEDGNPAVAVTMLDPEEVEESPMRSTSDGHLPQEVRP